MKSIESAIAARMKPFGKDRTAKKSPFALASLKKGTTLSVELYIIHTLKEFYTRSDTG